MRQALEVISSAVTTARQLAKLTGRLISFTDSLGSICRFMSRQLHLAICTRRSWDSLLGISPAVRDELLFWGHRLDALPFQSMIKIENDPEFVIYTDASSVACGGFCVQFSNKIFHSMWSNREESTKSSTWRELKGVELALLSFSREIRGVILTIKSFLGFWRSGFAGYSFINF